MKECPIKTLKRWFRSLLPTREDKRRQQLAAMVANLDEHALLSWREGHHLFFVLILTSALELRRFLTALAAHDSAAAIRHLDRVSLLMIGSGAAMRIAGDVNPDSYLKAVVPSMLKAHPKFSGSDSEDHVALVHVYRAIEPVTEHLPSEVIPAYRRFVSAVQTAMRAHRSVCASHRGDDRSSTGSGSGSSPTGVEILRRLGLSRLRFLFGKKTGKCPFHNLPIPTL